MDEIAKIGWKSVWIDIPDQHRIPLIISTVDLSCNETESWPLILRRLYIVAFSALS